MAKNHFFPIYRALR